MSLKGQITEDMKSAMKAGEKDRLKVVRLIMAAIKQVEVDTREQLDDAAVLAVITKMVKQRRDSIEQFEKGDREDLAAIERAEVEILDTYMPEQLSGDELAAMVDEVIARDRRVRYAGHGQGDGPDQGQGFRPGRHGRRQRHPSKSVSTLYKYRPNGPIGPKFALWHCPRVGLC